MRVLVLNGPNLGRLGSREPEVYGRLTHAGLAEDLQAFGAGIGLDVEVRQTDSLDVLIGWLREASETMVPVVINPAAFTHYAYELRDAVAAKTAQVIEVHISNPHARETFRHKSVVSGVANGCIMGFGSDSYRLALRVIAAKVQL